MKQKTLINPTLKQIREALIKVSNPQNTFKSIHIVGTNGKGSVATFLELLYLHFGICRVAKYISPHLVSVTERISVGGKDIGLEVFESLSRELFNENGIFNPFNNGFLTEFEKLTLIAFEYFKREGVEVAILEAGLGARWDATNTTATECRLATVLTNVGWDHMDYLGNSLEEIRAEKEAIKCSDVPHYDGCHHDERLVLQHVRRSLGEDGSFSEAGSDVVTQLNQKPPVPSTNPNSINGANFLLALKVFEDLTKIKVSELDKEQILSRFKTRYRGRFSYDTQSGVLIDGAHNPHGAKALNAFMQSSGLTDTSKIFVLAFLDKDLSEIIVELFKDGNFDPARDLVICTQVDSERATKAADISKIITEKFPQAKIIVEANLREAFRETEKLSTEKNLLVVTGSLYLLGEYYSSQYTRN